MTDENIPLLYPVILDEKTVEDKLSKVIFQERTKRMMDKKKILEDLRVHYKKKNPNILKLIKELKLL